MKISTPLVASIYFCCVISSLAQIPDSFKKNAALVPYRKGDKWGYCDRTKKIVIKPIYEETAPFEGNEVLVTVDMESFFIDRTGKRFDLLMEEVQEEVAEYITYDGIVNKYSRTYNLRQDSKTEKWCIYNFKKDLRVTAYEFDNYSAFGQSRHGYFLLSKNFKTGVVDSLGRVVVPLEYDLIDFSEFYDARHVPYLEVAKGPVISLYKFGLIDVNGNVVLPLEYQRVKAYYPADDFFIVLLNDRFGVVNSKKEIVVPFLYESLSYEDGAFRCQKNDMWGVFDKIQKVIIPFEYKELNPFVGGVSLADKDGKKGVINKKNETVIPFEYSYLSKITMGASYIAKKNGKYGVVDKSGKVLVPVELDNVEGLNFFYEYGVFATHKNDLVGLLEAPGHIICQPKYRSVEGVTGTDLFKVTTADNEIGYIDSTGKEYFDK